MSPYPKDTTMAVRKPDVVPARARPSAEPGSAHREARRVRHMNRRDTDREIASRDDREGALLRDAAQADG